MPASLSHRILAIPRRAKNRFVRFEQGQVDNVLIFAARRGGSSLLGDLFAGEQGAWYLNEPFGAFAGHVEGREKMRRLPLRLHSQYFDLDSEEETKVELYLKLLMTARAGIGGCSKTKGFLRSNRIVGKILNAPFLLDWIAERTAARVVVLTRHPAAQALSVLRNHWGFSSEAYFARPEFLAQFFDQEQIELGQRILADGSPWEKAILNWVTEVEYPTRRASTVRWQLSLEEFVLEPERVVDRLIEDYGCTDRERMLAQVRVPSSSSGMSTSENRAAVRAGGEALIRRWQEKVDANQVREAQTILDAFFVTRYHMEDPHPREE
jgi:hypothetical protein